jgi:enolase
MPIISTVRGRELLDSRGTPTLEVEIHLQDGSVGRALVPSGASTGEHEALELRDNDPKRFFGKGVLLAVKNVNEILGKKIVGRSFEDLRALDNSLLEEDASVQKSKLGGNSILGVSLAFAHALASSEKKPLFVSLNEQMGLQSADFKLPVPLMNIINGGMHADNGLEFQEFMIVPHGFGNFADALRAGVEVFQTLKKKLHQAKLSTSVGDEGGFAPVLKSNIEAMTLACEAIEAAGYQLGNQVSLALDVAASSFFSKDSGDYLFTSQGKGNVSRDEMVEMYLTLVGRFPVVSIEDGLDENDWDGWTALTERLGKKIQLVGDDIFVTQVAKVQEGIRRKCGNAVLIKVNQVGSLSETFDTMALCRENNYKTVVSHRSGETEDVTIAHLAVASGCGQIKTGSVSRSERTAKYNELLRIEEWGKTNGKPIAFAKPF